MDVVGLAVVFAVATEDVERAAVLDGVAGMAPTLAWAGRAPLPAGGLPLTVFYIDIESSNHSSIESSLIRAT